MTANKAMVAAHWPDLSTYVRSDHPLLWFSAAVGALPALETLQTRGEQDTDSRNSRRHQWAHAASCWTRAEGKTRGDAIALAKAQGFAEADPTRDLSGRDSADKLAPMIEAAFGQWLAPDTIFTRGIDKIKGDWNGHKLIARAKRG